MQKSPERAYGGDMIFSPRRGLGHLFYSFPGLSHGVRLALNTWRPGTLLLHFKGPCRATCHFAARAEGGVCQDCTRLADQQPYLFTGTHS